MFINFVCMSDREYKNSNILPASLHKIKPFSLHIYNVPVDVETNTNNTSASDISEVRFSVVKNCIRTPTPPPPPRTRRGSTGPILPARLWQAHCVKTR